MVVEVRFPGGCWALVFLVDLTFFSPSSPFLSSPPPPSLSRWRHKQNTNKTPSVSQPGPSETLYPFRPPPFSISPPPFSISPSSFSISPQAFSISPSPFNISPQAFNTSSPPHPSPLPQFILPPFHPLIHLPVLIHPVPLQNNDNNNSNNNKYKQEYADKSAFETHLGTPGFQDLGRLIQEQDLCARPPDIKAVEKIGGFLAR